MKEDLINLREQLHERYKKKYFIVEDTVKGIKICSDAFSPDDIEKLENTDEVIVQMEDLMRKGIEGFYQNNLPIESIGISSGIGLICTKDFFEALKNSNEDEYIKLMLEYWSHSKKYIPVNFFINEARCWASNSDERVCDINQEGMNNDFFKNRAFGVVDFDKFVIKLKELGYNLELLYGDGEELYDFNKLRQLLLDEIRNNEDIQFDLEVDLTKEKDSSESFGTK